MRHFLRVAVCSLAGLLIGHESLQAQRRPPVKPMPEKPDPDAGKRKPPTRKPAPETEEKLIETIQKDGFAYDVYRVSTYDHRWDGDEWVRNNRPVSVRQELRNKRRIEKAPDPKPEI